jgi:flagellar protein FlaG
MSDVERVSVTAVSASADQGSEHRLAGRNRQGAQSESNRYRLVIEEGPEVGSFVYVTLDRLTGEVVRRVPREELVKLAGREAQPGRVIDTTI